MLDTAVVKALYYGEAIMTPCLSKVVMFSQIARCTADSDMTLHSAALLPQNRHSLTIAAAAHFLTK